MKHVVVGIISRKGKDNKDEYLLVQSKKDFGKFTGFYYPPGGHLKEDEDEQQTLIREVKEELDLDTIPTRKIAETPGDVKDQVTHWWVCEAKAGKIKIKEEEISNARYFSREAMRKVNIWPATRNFFEEYIFN